MACQNCTVNISHIRGTPSNYKVRFLDGTASLTLEGTQVQPIYDNISKDDINNGISVYVGGPNDGSEYAQFWDGNNLTIRFENFYNSDCYRDFVVTCVPETTTTTVVADCCLETQWKFATHGFYFNNHDSSQGDYESAQLFGVTTLGFAPGIPPTGYSQTIEPDGEGISTENYGTGGVGGGRLCMDPIEPNILTVLSDPAVYTIMLQDGTNFVDAYGDSTFVDQANLLGKSSMTAGPVGTIQMRRDFADQANRKIVYVTPHGDCFTGVLASGGGIAILTKPT